MPLMIAVYFTQYLNEKNSVLRLYYGLFDYWHLVQQYRASLLHVFLGMYVSNAIHRPEVSYCAIPGMQHHRLGRHCDG